LLSGRTRLPGCRFILVRRFGLASPSASATHSRVISRAEMSLGTPSSAFRKWAADPSQAIWCGSERRNLRIAASNRRSARNRPIIFQGEYWSPSSADRHGALRVAPQRSFKPCHQRGPALLNVALPSLRFAGPCSGPAVFATKDAAALCSLAR